MPDAAGVRFHPEAEREFREAEAFYAGRSEQAAEDFHRQVKRTLALIVEAPERWAVHRRGTRRLRVRQFPFSIIYSIQEAVVFVVAVAHGSRRPEYWRHRH